MSDEQQAPKQEIFSTTVDKLPPGLRITITMESRSPEGMKWALAQGFKFASERWMGVTVHHADDPETRVSCRTTKLRKRK